MFQIVMPGTETEFLHAKMVPLPCDSAKALQHYVMIQSTAFECAQEPFVTALHCYCICLCLMTLICHGIPLTATIQIYSTFVIFDLFTHKEEDLASRDKQTLLHPHGEGAAICGRHLGTLATISFYPSANGWPQEAVGQNKGLGATYLMPAA